MTHAEPRQGDLSTEQPGDLGTERTTAPDAEQSGDLSTEQIASAGATTAAPADTTEPADTTGPAETTEQAIARSPRGDEQHRVPLLEPDELEGMVDRWRDIQASFVDAPRNAVKDADALVAALMQQLARTFASQREQLESSWSAGDSVSTEDLRQGLQRYRSFFERLLAA